MNGSQRPQRRRLPGGHNNATRQRPTALSGNAHRNYERYLALAREAASQGDTIETENFYQHAEHYLRTMREQTS